MYNDRNKKEQDISADASKYYDKSSEPPRKKNKTKHSGAFLRKIRFAFKDRTVVLTSLSVLLLAFIVAGALFINGRVMDKYDKDIKTAYGTQAQSGDETKDLPKKEEASLYGLSKSEVEAPARSTISDVYDADGNITVEIIRGDDGTYFGADYYEYEDGVKISVKRYGANGYLLNKTVFKTEDENILKTVYEPSFDKKGAYSGYSSLEYGMNETIEKKSFYKTTGALDYYLLYIYDESGRVSQSVRYTSYDEISVYTDYAYDAMGNITEVAQKDKTGKVVLRDVNYYDTMNRLEKEEHYTLGILKKYTSYVYDEEGNSSRHDYILKDEYTMTYEEIYYDK